MPIRYSQSNFFFWIVRGFIVTLGSAYNSCGRGCGGNSFRLVRSSEAESRGCVSGRRFKKKGKVSWNGARRWSTSSVRSVGGFDQMVVPDKISSLGGVNELNPLD